MSKRSHGQFVAELPIVQATQSSQRRNARPQPWWRRIYNSFTSAYSSACSYIYECFSVDYDDIVVERDRKRRRLQPPGAWIETPNPQRRSLNQPDTPSRRLLFGLDRLPKPSPSEPLENSPDLFPSPPRPLALLQEATQSSPLDGTSPPFSRLPPGHIFPTNSPKHIAIKHEAYATTYVLKKRKPPNASVSPNTSISKKQKRDFTDISPEQNITYKGAKPPFKKSPRNNSKISPKQPIGAKESPNSIKKAPTYKSPGYENDMGELPDATPVQESTKTVHWDHNSDVVGPLPYTIIKTAPLVRAPQTPQFTTIREVESISADTPDSVGSERILKDGSNNDILSPMPINGAEDAGIKKARRSISGFHISVSKGKRRLEEARREFEEQQQADAERKRKQDEDLRLALEARNQLMIKKQKERLAKKLEENRVVKDIGLEWESRIQKVLEIKNPAAVTAPGTNNTGHIDRRSMETLLPSAVPNPALSSGPGGWLNDEIVNAYLESAVDHGLQKTGFKARAGEVRKYHAFNSNMYNTYQNKGADGVKRWFKRPGIAGKNLLDVEGAFIPINQSMHWTLLVISGTNRSISYYDSLGGKGDKFTKFGSDVVKATLGEEFKEEEWKITSAGLSSRQSNSKDCGVFTCLNAVALLAGKTPKDAIQAENIPMGRKMMAATLVAGGFGGDFDF